MIWYVWEKSGKTLMLSFGFKSKNCNRCLRLLTKTANNIKAHATWIKKEERVCMWIWDCDIRFEGNHKIALGIPYLAITSIPIKCHKKKSQFQGICKFIQFTQLNVAKYVICFESTDIDSTRSEFTECFGATEQFIRKHCRQINV